MAEWIFPVAYVVGLCGAAFFGAVLASPDIGPKSQRGRYWHVVGLIATVLILSIGIFGAMESLR